MYPWDVLDHHIPSLDEKPFSLRMESLSSERKLLPCGRVTFQGSIPLDGIRPDVCTVGVACLLRIIKPLLFLRGGVAVRYIWYNFGGTHKVWALVRAWP